MLTTKEIKNLLDILKIKYKNYNFHSSQIMCHCPFHKDNHPSLSINTDKNIFHCFSCGRSGTLNTLAKLLTNKFIDEILYDKIKEFNSFKKPFKKINHNTVKNKKPENITLNQYYESLPDLSKEVKGVLYPVESSSECLEYLKKRKMPENAINLYNLLYAKDVIINGTCFKNRLIIPIFSENKKLIFLEGRDITFSRKEKCLYPKNSTKVLYDYHNLKFNQTLYIVEGLIDLIQLRTDPYFQNSTCVYGNTIKLSEMYIQFFNNFKEIVIIPDNDEAGENLIKTFKTIFPHTKVYKIHSSFKDVNEITEKTGMSIYDYRLKIGFRKIYKFF